jgi:threonine dehydrogenase-like Zn-dependent dehydrogenase
MKALLLEKYSHLVYKDVPEPDIAPDEVLVQVKACGICGSDIHGFDGSTGRRIPPLIMGHEASGIIARTGSGVTGWKAGADFSFLAGEDNLPEKIRSLTANRGTDIVFEAVGINQSVNSAIGIVRKGGKVVLVGNISPEVNFPIQKVVTSEIKVLGSCAICGEYEAVLNYMKMGKINVDDQIMAVASLSEGAAWFEKLSRKGGDTGKVILVP